MFDTIDAALYYPRHQCIYFFKGEHYLAYRFNDDPDQGLRRGVILQSGRELRRIGIDGWLSFPDEFHQGIDAALFYQHNGHAYFFKDDKYIKFLPGSGVVAMDSGRLIRTIGTDGWGSFPNSFKTGIDAALYHPTNGHAYFFKGDEYLKFLPGSGVVELHNRKKRRLGEDGWQGLANVSFADGLDAAMDYPPSGKCYFFRSRDYVRWTPGTGVDEMYPRRLGLLNRKHGGWPGLSHVVAGPMVGPVTDWSAKIWIWMTDAASADGLRILLNGSTSATFTTENLVEPQIAGAVDAINAGSQIRVLRLTNLSPATRYDARIMLGDVELDTVTFKTAPPRTLTGRVKIAFGSCADMSKSSFDVPAFEGMNSVHPDLALFCGDNCYYVRGDGTTNLGGDPPRDWESTERMLRRQVEARNHPQFISLSRSTPFYSTWDDHDFGYNNAEGTDRVDDWVGRSIAAGVFRAMWPNPYSVPGTDQPIYYSFRWGPVEVFMTDSRFHRDAHDQVVWGWRQLDWLAEGLTSSDAPLKIVVVACQFLFQRPGAGHLDEAPSERAYILDRVLNGSITGRVLFLSGDRHYSELMRMPPGNGAATTLEFTSSPLRRGNEDMDDEEVAGSRVWAVQRNGFGVVTVDVQSNVPGGAVEGTVTMEAREAFTAGDGRLVSRVIQGNNGHCRSTWDLASGRLT
jgi:alkaline phosphatase D